MAPESRIVLVSDPGDVEIHLDGRVLVVTHPAVLAPRVDAGKVEHVGWEAFRLSPSVGDDVDHLVLAGYVHAVSPGNRFEPVHEVIHRTTEGRSKYVVDRVPFRGEPWKVIWTCLAAGVVYPRAGDPTGRYTDSCRAETDWKQWLDGYRTLEPFTKNEIVGVLRGCACSDGLEVFGDVEVEWRDASMAAMDGYAQAKERAFREATTSTGILARLTRFAQGHCQGRDVPTPSRFFDLALARRSQGKGTLFGLPPIRIVATDLGVDRWLVGRLLSLAKLVDGLMADLAGTSSCRR